MKLRTIIIFLLASVLFLFTVVPVQAVRLGFDRITANVTNPANALIGETQLVVDVTDSLGGNNLSDTQALFTFRNIGSSASSICDVYYDDGTLLGIASIDNSSPGVVLFSQGASPGDLPGGENLSPPFVTTADFLAESDAGAGGVAAHGVNPGEYLGILFDLQFVPTQLYLEDVFNDLISGALRIGIHVQAFPDGGSENFANNTNGFLDPQAIPEPATMLLLGSGLIGFAVSGRKKLKKRNG
jgi:hypothetical protein